ncbi:uridine diphosphate-N-acetylglucosamine-binding protein YvcK [Fodinicola feengrottensis]|uniref:Putative gluconeogenesis factor n=1 Tax=Fodinicola feengrottensis TaxID=435914 RepID=A0ABP4USJ5_9ACTN
MRARAGKVAKPRRTPKLRVVAIGGGHGLAASVRALKHLDQPGRRLDLSAVVSVADDGASSGRVRSELGILPPGDLRKSLVALAGDSPTAVTAATLFEHRLGGTGPLAGHAVGNLILAGLLEQLGDAPTALAAAAAMLDARGRVLPAAERPLVLGGEVVTAGSDRAEKVGGQAALVRARGRIRRLWIDPEDVPACPAAVQAIEAADAVVIGPGSWFTSVLAPLLVPGIGAAVARTRAKVVLVLNLAAGPGETEGMTAAAHVDVLAEHLPGLRCDAIVTDPSVAPANSEVTTKLDSAAAAMGARVIHAPVAAADGTPRHDQSLLAAALWGALDGAYERMAVDSWR